MICTPKQSILYPRNLLGQYYCFHHDARQIQYWQLHCFQALGPLHWEEKRFDWVNSLPNIRIPWNKSNVSCLCRRSDSDLTRQQEICLGAAALKNGCAEGKQANKKQPRGTPCVTQSRSKPVRGVTAAYQYCFNFNLSKFRLAKELLSYSTTIFQKKQNKIVRLFIDRKSVV